uniref:Glycine zipper 2TM domain-containing protein n=1 Tax=Bionectria ochroleuca TaxID=29856 RepID=A0A8H7NKE8_BIOOC
MSNQGYYGHTYTQVQPQRASYSLGNSPYSHGQGGYIPPYHQQADYYRAPAPGFYQAQNEMVGAEGERGLGATVVGGGAAGWAAHKAGSGMFGSLASAAAGAIGANFLENKLKKHRNKKHDKH